MKFLGNGEVRFLGNGEGGMVVDRAMIEMGTWGLGVGLWMVLWNVSCLHRIALN
jgi:hypothetical protein